MNRPRFLLLLLVLAIGLLAPSVTQAQSTSALETQVVNGQSYVTGDSIKKFYGFTAMKKSGRQLTFERKDVRMKFLLGQQDVYMNGVKFIFSFPVLASSKGCLIHRIDFAKIVHPVLCPWNVNKKGAFDTVIIDPGHGGHDSGARSPHGNGMEKNHAMEVANRLSTHLRKRGFKVGLTRSTDKYLTLQQRVDFANKFPNAIFISLHFNSGGGGRAEGIETFTLSPKGVAHYGRGLIASDYKDKPGNAQDSANIALATAIHSNCIRYTGRKDRGIRRARYSVITGVRHPAVLVEGGFLNNRVEGSLIKSTAYKERLALAIADAVVKYKVATEKMQRR
ncbi:MAG: N-acetylmuramoyl-L-alanine amidase [Verrucomicrobiota bacterium JB023]|nr:N-acetylmuramoyl-L-alanine amidase [Verrucomicrobiota bacterium JB023]